MLRPESPHDPRKIFSWAQPSAGNGAHQLQGIRAADGDGLHSPIIASSLHGGPSGGDSRVSPLRITGKRKRKGKHSFYCSKCNRDGVDHRYEDCPLWRECLYCQKKGHYSHDCHHPHARCTVHRCQVFPDHQYYGRNCPVKATELQPITHLWDEYDVDDVDAGEALWEDIDWESIDRGDWGAW
jgi:hypothetical protein